MFRETTSQHESSPPTSRGWLTCSTSRRQLSPSSLDLLFLRSWTRGTQNYGRRVRCKFAKRATASISLSSSLC